jgi:hypothetical protein
MIQTQGISRTVFAFLVLVCIGGGHWAEASNATDVTVSVVGGELAGELVTTTSRPRAIVVMVSGGGWADRDHRHSWGFKPFKLLADLLEDAGVASIRFDGRGVGKTTAPHDGDPESEAKDLSKIVSWVRERPGMETLPLILMGHSLGGMLALSTSDRIENIHGIIFLCAPTLSGPEALRSQRRNVLLAEGISEPELTQLMGLFDHTLSASLGDQSWVAVEQESREKLKEKAADYLEEHQSVFFRWMAVYDPATDIEDYDGSLLTIFGANDIMVDVSDHWEAAGELVSRHPASRRIVVPDMNHALQTTSIPGPEGWPDGGVELAAGVDEIILEWLDANL